MIWRLRGRRNSKAHEVVREIEGACSSCLGAIHRALVFNLLGIARTLSWNEMDDWERRDELTLPAFCKGFGEDVPFGALNEEVFDVDSVFWLLRRLFLKNFRFPPQRVKRH